MGDETQLKQKMAGSWLSTFQTVMGSRSHKPSFVVFDIGQSGGMILADWFQAHENISFQANILSQAIRFPRLSVYQRVRQANTEVYGFTMTVEQLRQVQQLANPNQFLQDLHRGGCRVIYLKRRDPLRHAIATLKNQNTSCRFNSPGAPLRTGKFTVDASELIACLKYLDNQRVEADAIVHEIPHLTLTYEDDLMDPNSHEAAAHQLSDFLMIPNIVPVGNAMKLVHQKLADLVTNYDELSEALAASDYAYLLSKNRYLMTT